MENTLNGRKALVTGGASGIGAASARALAARGAKVVIADVDESAAAALADEIGGTSWAVNLLDVESLQTLSLDCDILVNNAGIQRISPIEEFDPADFRRIINLSSVHGIRASPFKSAYVAAKHGLEGLSKVTALEGGAHGVTSNCINPGYVRTPLVESQIADQAKVHGIPESEVLAKIMLTESAVKRLVEPEEVASLVGWLSSDDAGMVTGASYTMDGGWSAR